MNDKIREKPGVQDVPEVNGEPPITDDSWFPLISDAADLVEEELPPVVEIIHEVVTEHSKLIIGSGSKSYKTWLTMHAALCIAHGLDFLEHKTTRSKVLYVNLELKAKTFTRRVQAIASALNVPIDRDWFKHLPLRGKLTGQKVFLIIHRIIRFAKHFKANVVVIDPLYKLNLGDENAVGDQTRLFNDLDQITTEANCTLILNDHFGKGNQSEKDPLDAIRGSSAKGGDCDCAMILRKHEVDNCYSVDMVHRELPPVEPFVIGWNYPLMELRPELNAKDMKKAQGGATPKYDPLKLLEAIRDTSKEHPISYSAWATKANIARQTLTDTYASSFRLKGWIATTGEGNTARQYITKPGRDMLQNGEVPE